MDESDGNNGSMVPVTGSEWVIDADLVLLAMGFTGPPRDGLLRQLRVKLTKSGTVQTDGAHATSIRGVFAAGDVNRGASLIVWAIREGRDAAARIDSYLRDGKMETARQLSDWPGKSR